MYSMDADVYLCDGTLNKEHSDSGGSHMLYPHETLGSCHVRKPQRTSSQFSEPRSPPAACPLRCPPPRL